MSTEDLAAEIEASGYPAPPSFGAEQYPHAQYARAVHAALVASRAEPVEWYAHDTTDGLAITFYFRPYAPEPMPDGRLPLVPGPEDWLGHGFQLGWTQGRGWHWSPLDEHSEAAWADPERLQLAELADPAAVADAALQLLDGNDTPDLDVRIWAYAPFLAAALQDGPR